MLKRRRHTIYFTLAKMKLLRHITPLRYAKRLYFLLFSGLGAQTAHPEKKSVTKKVLRLSPPHRDQSPEVPFCYRYRDSNAKSHAGGVACEGMIAMIMIRMPKNVRVVRNNFVRTLIVEIVSINSFEALFFKF